MPLEILLVLVVGGIAGIAILLHLFGFSKKLKFETEEDAKSAWQRAYPDDLIKNVLVSESQELALIETDKGGGLVWAFGADSVARRLKPGKSAPPHPARDYPTEMTAPHIPMRLSDAERPIWNLKMEEMK